MPGRPDLRDNFVGRMRAALGWFSNLPTLRRRSILMKGLVAAAGGVRDLHGAGVGCREGHRKQPLLWSLGESVPTARPPAFTPLGYGGTGAGSSLSGGADRWGRAGQASRPRATKPEPVRGRPGPSSATPVVRRRASRFSRSSRFPRPRGFACARPGGPEPSSASPAAEEQEARFQRPTGRRPEGRPV